MSKRTRQSIRVIISMILVISLLGGSCVFAEEKTTFVATPRETVVYWVKNADIVEKIFSVKVPDSGCLAVADGFFCRDESDSEYHLFIGEQELVLKGAARIESAADGIYLTGLFSTTDTVNGYTVDVYGVVYYNVLKQKLNAGITVSPSDANSLNQMAFMGVGDPLDLDSMGLGWSGADKTVLPDTNGGSSSGLRDGDDGSDYTYKGTHLIYATNGIYGRCEEFQVWHHQQWERVCVAGYSGTGNIANYYSGDDDVPFVYVNTVKLGLRPTSEGAHYISGLYDDYPINYSSMSNSSLFTASFISSILSIVSSSIVPGMTSLMLSAFNAVLNLCKNQNNASTSWSVSQSNASVTFNFAQTLWNHSNIEFDSAPITVKFGIGASQTGTYSFTGYSSMSFFVLIAHPEANTSTTLYIYLPEESMSISSFYIDNSD